MDNLQKLIELLKKYEIRGYDGEILLTLRHGKIQKVEKLKEKIV